MTAAGEGVEEMGGQEARSQLCFINIEIHTFIYVYTQIYRYVFLNLKQTRHVRIDKKTVFLSILFCIVDVFHNLKMNDKGTGHV